MMAETKIQWADFTFNPWRGCTKVSAGCANCYAETMSKRNPGVLGIWGPKGTRVVASESQWKEPLKWNRQAIEWDRICLPCDNRIRKDTGSSKTYGCYGCGSQNLAPNRPRVFCASLADVGEDWQGPMVDSIGRKLHISPSGKWCPEGLGSPIDETGWRPLTMQDVRNRLFAMIDQTPNIDWLLLTKRPENIEKMMPGNWLKKVGTPVAGATWKTQWANRWSLPSNVWIGTSVENQKAADERILHLLKVPAKVRFLSVEPLLGAVDLSVWLTSYWCDIYKSLVQVESPQERGIHWAIIGGESGPNARPCHIDWIKDIVRQCKEAGVPPLVKQLGSNPRIKPSEANWWPNGWTSSGCDQSPQPLLNDPKGGNPEEWAVDLRVRDYPEVID